MPKRLREYHRPKDLADALELLRRADPLLIGPRPTAIAERGTEAVVDLSDLNLAYIVEREDATFHLGALTPLQSLVDSGLLKSQANGLLSEAAQFSASSGLRHVATVGGAVLSREGPPEVLLALLALDAIAVVEGRGAATRNEIVISVADLAPQIIVMEQDEDDSPREIPLTDFLSSAGALSPGELLVEVKFKRRPAHAGGALARVGRTPRDEAIVAAVAVVEAAQGVARRVRLAVGPRPQRLVSVEKRLGGRPLTPEILQAAAAAAAAEAQPLSDFRASAEYRRAMVGVLARRALEMAWQRAAAHLPRTAGAG